MNPTDLAVELPPPIAEALDRGTTIITANQRAARTLRHAFDRQNLLAGLTTWQPAPILPWDAWAANLWQRLLIQGEATSLLLNRTQEHTLWRSILSTDAELSGSLRSVDSLADLAADAWALLTRHHGRQRLRGVSHNLETRALQRWTVEFERRCQTQRLLPKASLEDALRKAIEENRLSLVEPIALVGFDDLTPAQRSLVDAIAASGTRIDELRISITPERRALVKAADESDEIATAARWARSLLESDPATRIAFIAPSHDERRGSIDRIFREVLAPELEDIQAPGDLAPYEFSLGVPLSETPMVRIALDLLRWALNPLPVERVSTLLVSPLFAMNEQERNARAAFDAFELRRARLLLPEISLPWLANTLRRSRRRPQLSDLLHALEAMARVTANALPERRSHAGCADFIRELLQAAHWGRDTGEDSVEFQTRQKWESSLDELTTLDFDGSSVSLAHAVAELERITQQTMFAPESHDAPIQVMGPLEAAGSSFDALWFLGASDLDWPVRSTIHPLLPWSLQRELGIPGADPTLDDARAQRLTERLAVSAPTAIFSYAVESADGMQRPSPLLQSLHLETSSPRHIAPPATEPSITPLEEFSDLATLPAVPDHIVSGGAEVLKLQAACGFRAFAERRLGSAELREIELGMDAAERGSIVHHVLEHFWKNTASQATLKAMTRDERNASLAQSIEYGLRRTVGNTLWERAYVDLQRARLWALLDPWLELELRRDPFTVKFSEEETSDVHIGPLRLNVRVDRVDVTDTGKVILDYKTGGAKSAQWQGDRPDEPQLPLYAVLAAESRPDTPLADLAFAQIRAGKEMALEGFHRKLTTEAVSPKRPSLPLEEQLLEWRRVLEELATAFYRGDARVDPKNYPTTCLHCAQRILCRLNPAAFDEDLDEETPFD